MPPTVSVLVDVVISFYWNKMNTVEVLAILIHSPSSFHII